MQTSMMRRSAVAARVPAAKRVNTRAFRCRAVEQDTKVPTVVTDAPVPEVSAATTNVGAAALLSPTQEAINGRSAMLGFVAAVVAEVSTGHSVWSQIAGKISDFQYVEKPIGASSLGFFAIVVLTTVATLAPKLMENLDLDSRSVGPFTPDLEKTVGRVAMIGFAGLVLTEVVKGSALF